MDRFNSRTFLKSSNIDDGYWEFSLLLANQFRNAVEQEVVEDDAAPIKEATNEVTPKEDRFVSFAELETASRNSTPEVKEARATAVEGWNTEKKGKTSIRENTFTSVDPTGERRTYTPNDQLRSTDGRYFKVVAQNYASKKGTLYAPTMPIVREVDASGRKFLSKETVLPNHAYMRAEVRQATVGLSTKYPGYHSNTLWGPYVTTDSILKPNDFKYQASIRNKAETGIVTAILNSEFINNDAKELALTQYAKDYDLSTLNDVMHYGDTTPVTIKINNKGEGENFLDIYVGDTAIGRLDRNSNLAHDALLAMADKGELTGKITSKFSTAKNLVKMRGEDGRPVMNSLKDFKERIPKQFLPNGKLYIAQTPGENVVSDDLSDFTLGEDGEVVSAGYLELANAAGEINSIEIPYGSMSVGETYILMLSPGGRIVPVATSANFIADLESKKGNETYVDDVTDSIMDSVTEVLSEVLEDEAGFEEAIREKESRTTNKSTQDIEMSIRQQKIDILKNKEKALKEVFKDKVYTHFRPNNYLFVKVGEKVVKGETVPVYSERITSKNRKRRLINPDLFKLDVEVDPATRKISPVILTSPKTAAGAVYVKGKPSFTKT